jgi:hypothetical protein
MTSDRAARRHPDSPDSDLRVAVVGRALFLGTMTGIASGAVGGSAAELGAGELYGAGVFAGIVGAVAGFVAGALLAPVMVCLARRRPSAAERPAVAALGVLLAVGMWLGVSGGSWVLHAGTVVSMAVAGAMSGWALPWVLRPVRGDHRVMPGTQTYDESLAS